MTPNTVAEGDATALELSARADAVRFERLTVTRGGREVLHRIEGGCGAGRVTGLFGPSGSGA
jgi:ABC-type transporter Mla maintaining outer membrane lipid asymmetry ATPase subunit MlaF